MRVIEELDIQPDTPEEKIIQRLPKSEAFANFLNNKMKNREGGANQRLAEMFGMLTKDQTIRADIQEDDKSIFSQERYNFFFNAPFIISSKCCDVMKKQPVHKYASENERYSITAQMASESKHRTIKWIKNGCNGFNMKQPISNPMAFWVEQDVLLYIKMFNIEICSVYGDVVQKMVPRLTLVILKMLEYLTGLLRLRLPDVREQDVCFAAMDAI